MLSLGLPFPVRALALERLEEPVPARVLDDAGHHARQDLAHLAGRAARQLGASVG